VIAILSLTICQFAVGAEAATTRQSSEFAQALHPREWEFPRDHGRHDGFKTEWWYFTGNLRDGAGHRFGYQLTFFRTAYAPHATTRQSSWGMNDLYFAHAAITDVSGQTFTFKDCLQRGRPGLAEASDQTLDVSLLDWSARLGERGIRLQAKEKRFAIDLTCAADRAPVLQGKGGVNAKGPNPQQASYYYSMTRLGTAGTLEAGGKRYAVEGRSWMDHEFSSNALSPEQVGWDWMGLTLADGSDLMIYRLRNGSGGTDYLSGTRISADGQPHYLVASEIQLEGSKPWKSAASGGAYPQEWRLVIAGQAPLVVRSLMPRQELLTPNSTKVNYFEGAAEVLDAAGRQVGEGYLEMTGYAKPLGGAL
jgi:predicted secreted hydrolase